MTQRRPERNTTDGNDISGYGRPSNEDGQSGEDGQTERRWHDWHAVFRNRVTDGERLKGVVLTVLLILSLLLAAGGLAYAIAVPDSDDRFTEFYLLSENESGDLVAGGYPKNFTCGENEPVVVGITNQESQRTNYTIVVELQRLRDSNGSAGTVVESQELGRLDISVPDNETMYVNYDISPTLTGQRLRLVFLLYRGTAPADPTAESAYRELHLMISVSSPSSIEGSTSPSKC